MSLRSGPKENQLRAPIELANLQSTRASLKERWFYKRSASSQQRDVADVPADLLTGTREAGYAVFSVLSAGA